jgi:hypothetical protein
MNNPLFRQLNYALAAGLSALVLIEGSASAKARDLALEGNWLIAVGAVVIAVVALWMTCIGALRSDRRDRYRSNSGGDRGGPVYTDVDGYMHVR